MDNPLILPKQEPEPKPLAGRAQRKATRQRNAEKNLHFAIRIFQRHLPGMLQEPPNTQGFEQAWPEIDEDLRDKLKSEKAYRHAYRFICRQLEAGNQKGIWRVEVPPPYITLPRRRTARTERWQQNSILVAGAEAQWSSTLDDANLAPNSLFGRMLLSMVLYGGLNRPMLWPAVAKALTQRRPLRGNRVFIWLELELSPEQSRSSNFYEQDSDTKASTARCTISYLPDPISLGLLRQFLKHKPDSWQAPSSPSQCLEFINREFGTQLSRKQMASGGITIAEHLPGIDLPQVLVEYATGRQASASLPREYWQRLLHPELHKCEIQAYHTLTSFPAITASTSKKPTGSKRRPYLFNQLQKILRQDPVRPRSKQEIIRQLRALSQDSCALADCLLIDWLVNHLDDKGNALSTARRYFHSIAGEWLLATEDQDLSQYSSEEFHDLYLSILNRPCSLKDREYRAARLEALHEFSVQQQGFPPLPERLHTSTHGISHISAAIVDEPLFSALLAQIDRLEDLDEYQQRMFKCFLIMAYRTGLRPSELAKLRLRDIDASPEAWLFIRNNQHGSNKTEAALRKVPLFPLLLPWEADLMNSYLGERRLNSKSAAELLFHRPENPKAPLDTRSLSSAVGKILKELSGGVYYRLYHLRHSALSRLQLLLHHDQLSYPACIDALLPYPPEQRKYILEIITGRERLRDRYNALATFAGHSSPEITLSTYLHFTDVVLGLCLQNNQRALSPGQAQNLLGLTPHCIQQRSKTEEAITPANTAASLRKKLAGYLGSCHQGRLRKTKKTATPNMHIEQSHLRQMIAALTKIEAGQDYRDTADWYRIPLDRIQRWYQSALALKAITTEKLRPRLFPKSRRHQLLPASPVDAWEKEDLAHGLNKLRALYKNNKTNKANNTRDELRWVFQYTLTHCNSSRSGIRFDDPKQFRRFMAIANQVFPQWRWRLALRCSDDKHIALWRAAQFKIDFYPVKQRARFKQGTGWLTLRHCKEAERKEAGKTGYSSHNFRILMHQLAIILFSADEISSWQASSDGEESKYSLDQTVSQTQPFDEQSERGRVNRSPAPQDA